MEIILMVLLAVAALGGLASEGQRAEQEHGAGMGCTVLLFGLAVIVVVIVAYASGVSFAVTP